MELDPVLLSRIQFAFVVSFHIIFPAFTIGLAAWLATIEGMRLATGYPLYQRVFDFWLKVFALSFGMGVVSGIVMAFQFGSNWSVLSERSGAIQGPLLGYEAFTAFMLEATFFGIMLLGRERTPPWFYFLSCCMVALATMLSSFWIMCNNTWMQVPLGHTVADGRFVPDDWWAITTGPIVRLRWPHMLLAAFLTTGMSVIATGAWYLLRGTYPDEGRVMLRWGLWLVAVIIPVQMVFGHLNGDYVHQYQPAKFAAIEARWHTEQPASEVMIAIPDEATQQNLYALTVPRLGRFIASGTWDSREVGLDTFRPEDRPPVLIPFLTFRLMVGLGLVMLAVSWFGLWLRFRALLGRQRNLARGDRRLVVRGIPDGLRGVSAGLLHPGAIAVVRADLPRCGLRVSPRCGCTPVVGLGFLCRLDRRRLCPGGGGRSNDPRHPGGEQSICRRLVRL